MSSGPKHYQKVPVEVLAMEFTRNTWEELKEWGNGNIRNLVIPRCMDGVAECEVITSEDGSILKVKHIASEGDYIIKGIEGEFYPCKPNIFKKTYVRVNNES